MKFLFTLSLVLVLASSALSVEADDVPSRYWRAGADRNTGLCPNGAFINPGANETCAKVQSPSPELVKAMKESVGTASCNINELIANKQTIGQTLDQFSCTESGVNAGACITGLALPVFGGLQVVADGYVPKAQKLGVKLMDKRLESRMNRLVAKHSGAVLSGKAELAYAKKVIALSTQRIAMLDKIRAIDAKIVRKTLAKGMARRAIRTGAKVGSGVGAALLLYDAVTLVADTVEFVDDLTKAGKPTDRFKGMKGFIEFAQLSDKEQCELLAVPDNGLRQNYVSQSVAMQTYLSESMPEKVMVRCGPREGTKLALLKFRDGSTQMRGFTFDQDGNLKSASGYHMAVPMNPEAENNFANAERMDRAADSAQKKDFHMTVNGDEFTFSSDAVKKTDPALAARQEKKAIEESTRLTMVGPMVFEACEAAQEKAGSSPSGQGTPGVQVQDAK